MPVDDANLTGFRSADSQESVAVVNFEGGNGESRSDPVLVAIRTSSLSSEGFDARQLFKGRHLQYSSHRVPLTDTWISPADAVGNMFDLEVTQGRDIQYFQLVFQDEIYATKQPGIDEAAIRKSPLSITGANPYLPIGIELHKEVDLGRGPEKGRALRLSSLIATRPAAVDYYLDDRMLDRVFYEDLPPKGTAIRAVDKQQNRWPKTIYFLITPSEKLKFVPRFYSRGVATVAENTSPETIIYDAKVFAVEDGEEDFGIQYSLGGPDANAFALDARNGQIRFRVAPDYEKKDEYSLTVTASSGTLSSSIPLKVTVTDVAEALNFNSEANVSIAENTPVTTAVYDAQARIDRRANDQGIRYRLSGSDASAFDLDEETGVLRFRSPPNYERKEKD